MTTKKQTPTKSSKPAYIAYHVRNNRTNKARASGPASASLSRTRMEKASTS
jgi:hypothetical protein